MTKRAAIAGVYSDLKTVKTRSVCQIVVEVPIERGKEIVDAFGFPQPGSEVYVAIARLNGEAGNNSKLETPPLGSPVSPTKQEFTELPLVQQAALLAKREAFWKFVIVENESAAAEWIREHCQVASRSEIQEHTKAGEVFKDLYNRFDDWMHDIDRDDFYDD